MYILVFCSPWVFFSFFCIYLKFCPQGKRLPVFTVDPGRGKSILGDTAQECCRKRHSIIQSSKVDTSFIRDWFSSPVLGSLAWELRPRWSDTIKINRHQKCADTVLIRNLAKAFFLERRAAFQGELTRDCSRMVQRTANRGDFSQELCCL